jgi:hypothetical protein
MIIEKKLSDFELHGLCGAIVHDIPFDQILTAKLFVEPTPERDFKLGVVPQERIIKLCKKEHADAFFDSGALQFGSYIYYNSFDHTEIGDNQEGIVTLLAKTPTGVIGGKYGTGYNQLMFCVFVGDLDRKTMKSFGYDSGFVINDAVGFANAVAEATGAISHTFGRCLYRPHKAVLAFLGSDINRHEISHRTGEMVNAAKHFIKAERYSHQKELRFLWEQSSDVSEARLFDCSVARQYCSPLTLA